MVLIAQLTWSNVTKTKWIMMQSRERKKSNQIIKENKQQVVIYLKRNSLISLKRIFQKINKLKEATY